MTSTYAQRWPIGTKISKCFNDGKYYDGEVVEFDATEGWYVIKYEDDDGEDFDNNDMEKWVVVARHNGPSATDKDPPPHVVSLQSSDTDSPSSSDAGALGGRLRRRRKVVSYKEDDYGFDDEESSIEDSKPARKKSRSNGTTKAAGKLKRDQDGDDESSFEGMDAQDESSDDEVLVVDEGEDEDSDDYGDDDDEDDEVVRPSKARGRRSQGKAPSRSTAKRGKSLAESFNPIDTPIFWKRSLSDIKKHHEYLDPCGMEATDDIIDHLVGEQVLKIETLLLEALEKDPTTLGSSERPLNLGTACSGTDAPALAMMIVQEQMERLHLGRELHYKHVFSCEKEPFKQSYIARNFDSLLYPDIVKMTDEKPRDVYGRETAIPPFNLFVAGTSCKNFSLLHATKRLDIEDKGCSGETFLSSVELLFKEQPDFCIFENVVLAPWAKMQEYITGRVNLATVYDTSKQIKSMAAKDTKVKELTFERRDDGAICAIEIPLQVGVRCGATVGHFIKVNSDSTKRLPVKWPSPKMKTCSLEDLIKANHMNAKEDILVFDTPCMYCTCIQKVDTKNYGLPQTRQRTYMFVWKPDNPKDYNDDLGLYWQALVKFLESPVRHSLEAFILDTDHDNIRVFREALHGPPGRHTKRSAFQEPDFWTSGSANLKHNKIARDKLGIEEMARPNVGGAARGAKQIPPHYWLEYLDTLPQRELDMLDILHISAARDAESHDSNFTSFFWNVSQNVSKEKHRSAVPGIAGCISPGGEFFVTNLGRPLLGCEKLLVQGIPYFRLALGSESEVEIGDLAGNAMSLTVVCATMLAAISCRHLRSQCPVKLKDERKSKAEEKAIKQILNHLKAYAGKKHSKSVIVPDNPPSFGSLADVDPIFKTFAQLAPAAVKSSVWCTCETSGRNSKSMDFLQCQTCRVACCSSCLGSHAGYQMNSHVVEERKLTFNEHRMGDFVSKLRNVAPPSLYFGKEGIESLARINKGDLHRVSDLWKFVFNLQKIRRERRKWVIHYNARDNNGVGEVVAEFRVSIGELWTQSLKDTEQVELGMKGELISFFPAKTSPLVTGELEPCAVVVVKNDSTPSECEWMAKGKTQSISVNAVGSDPAPSFRVELGLKDQAERSMKAASRGAQEKHFKNAELRGEAGRWLYRKNWKEWPNKISLTSAEFDSIDGDYHRSPCRQTTNQSALWIRHREGKNETPLYLIIKPNVGRTGPDAAVISTSISHDDVSAILVSFSTSWQPSDALREESLSQRVERSNWVSAQFIQCSVPQSSIAVHNKEEMPSFLVIDGLSNSEMNMLYPFQTASNCGIIKMNVHFGVEAQKVIRAFNYLCVPSIMCHVSQSPALARDLSPHAEWRELRRSLDDPMFGCCDKIIPNRPLETWVYDEEREVWARRSSPEESRQYKLKLDEAQRAFEFLLDKQKGRLEINCYPEVAAHYAARFLLDGRGNAELYHDTRLSYRLSDTALQSDPEYSPFKVFPCRKEVPTNVPLKFELYERQQKVVTKMSMIERGDVEFEEIEMSEHEMPGSTGFSLTAKASRTRKISGGVIADAIGAGKTVISIALIKQGLDAARAARSFPRQSGATLVVVPKFLVDQWESMIHEFATGINVLNIRDTKALKKISVQQIIEADVVIFPVDILESSDYTENLAAKRGKKTEISTLPKNMSNAEKSGARGLWIPATSRDPYGIGSANEMKNQKLRELSAYFTYSYLENVNGLRTKNFEKTDKGVPLEYFEWERIIVDEVHECLMSEKDYFQTEQFHEKNRRASRELLGITQKDVKQR